MTDTTPSADLADLGRYLTAAPADRHLVWLGKGVPYIPETLPDRALIISDTFVSTAPGHEVLTREGELDSDCEQLIIDNVFDVTVMGYSLSAYLPCTSPTLLRLASDEDWQVFLEDADDALATGFVPEQLLLPQVLLEDAHALRTGTAAADRLTITAEATTSCLPGTSTSPACWDNHGRDWLRRYLTVLEVLRGLRVREQGVVEVSGLGMRMHPHSPSALVEPPAAPVVVRTQSGLRCVLPGSGRFLAVPELVATAVELIGTAGATAETLPELLGITSEMTSPLLDALHKHGLAPQEMSIYG
ncbi:hypothetical protein D4740_02150 [Actinomyces sp. 2119]|uniref:hypothetical protein n=1 Tax=Actinomyces sp. 2119 TaxID=2321393 RepID=UPI000E6B96F0|nr:hypothetical protein [Actinomyces sp. 2119]RJF43797.1 hypothetical protein D4740_02150 [Actinomyces sp. 2119]